MSKATGWSGRQSPDGRFRASVNRARPSRSRFFILHLEHADDVAAFGNVGKLGFEGDEIVNLALRSTLAAGLGLKIIDTPETSFNVFGGAAYSADRYDTLKLIAGKTSKRFSRTSALWNW